MENRNPGAAGNDFPVTNLLSSEREKTFRFEISDHTLEHRECSGRGRFCRAVRFGEAV
jgi:hypothetical protein